MYPGKFAEATPDKPAIVMAETGAARVVAFSDAVIAIAVTLLVLEIRPPADTRDLLSGLGARCGRRT